MSEPQLVVGLDETVIGLLREGGLDAEAELPVGLDGAVIELRREGGRDV